MTTVVALFKQYENAEAAFDDLVANGFDMNSISAIVPDKAPRGRRADEARGVASVPPMAAANAGGITANTGAPGIGGAVPNFNGMLVPGVAGTRTLGPLLADIDPNTRKVSEVAKDRDLGQVLMEHELPEELAQIYAEGVRRGHLLLAVDTDQVADAKSIMNNNNAADPEALKKGWELDDRLAAKGA